MSRHVDLVWIPGLTEAWVDRTPFGRSQPVRARLRGAFPCVPATIEATLTSGLTPQTHGHLGQRSFEDRQAPAATELSTWEEVEVHRWTEVWSRLLREGANPSLESKREILTRIESLAAGAGESRVVVVCGGPGYVDRKTSHRVDLSGLEGLAHRAEGGVLRVCAPDDVCGDVRAQLLRRRGVQLVLRDRGLELWGARHPQAGDLLALAEPGWSFVDEAIAYGHPDEATASPVVLMFGREATWPADVHDIRLAPTLASFLGRPLESFADRPLPL